MNSNGNDGDSIKLRSKMTNKINQTTKITDLIHLVDLRLKTFLIDKQILLIDN